MKLNYFITQISHFQQLLAFAHDNNLELILRSFGDPGQAGYIQSPKDVMGAISLYREHGCREIVLSNGGLPDHRQDWSFLNREQDNLIVIEGGRQNDHAVEMSKMRLLAKRSKLRPLFPAIVSTIRSICVGEGMKTCEGVVYNEIVYEPNAVSYTLLENLLNEATKHTYIPIEAR